MRLIFQGSTIILIIDTINKYSINLNVLRGLLNICIIPKYDCINYVLFCISRIKSTALCLEYNRLYSFRCPLLLRLLLCHLYHHCAKDNSGFYVVY